MNCHKMSARTSRGEYLLSSSVLAVSLLLAAQTSAYAQQSGADVAVEEVIVTGSRTITNGANSPTPLTVVSAEQLVAAQPGNLADAVTQLPSFMGSFKSTSTGTGSINTGAGANWLSLRGLSPQRTLVLLDGRRMVPTTVISVTDANLIPQGLVKRVDVVTGGASAAYGSDAVAGVVNFILDNNFQGLKGYVQGGQSTYSDATSAKASLNWGGSFLDDRLKVMAAAGYFRQSGIDDNYAGRGWANDGWGLISSGTTPDSVIIARDVRSASSTAGGLISACQPAGRPCSLALTKFADDGKSVSPFNVGQYRTATTQSGGDGVARRVELMPTTRSATGFGRATFEVTDNLEVFAEFNYSNARAYYLQSVGLNDGTNAFTIYADNAYLPPALKTAMANEGITSFSFGRSHFDFGKVHLDQNAFAQRVATGFSASLGDWGVSGYYQYGRSRMQYEQGDNPIHVNLYNAADAVLNPTTNVIQCRSTYMGYALGTGCVPINLFGVGNASAAAIDYVTGVATSRTVNYENVIALDVQGQAFDLPAGPLAVAAGIEHRSEKASLTTDALTMTTKTDGRPNPTAPISAGNQPQIRGLPSALQGQIGAYYLGGNQPFAGSFTVNEAYVEVNAPLLDQLPLAESLTFNGAVRYADYSTAGGVTTWKAGLIWQPVEDIRFRATRSRDVRAPNISELFTTTQNIIGTTFNDTPRGPGIRTSALQVLQGNLGLKPEKADTTVLGIVYKPSFVPGLTLSVDYYDIDVNDVIAVPLPQQVLNDCAAGDAANCGLIDRASDGTLAAIRLPNLNLANLRTKGQDFEIGYRFSMDSLFAGAGGEVQMRLLANHTETLALTIGTTKTERVGTYAINISTAPTAAPEWTGSLQINYDNGPWNVFVQERYIHSATYDNTRVLNPNSIQGVSPTFYTDLTVGYEFEAWGSGSYEAYLTVNNLFDQDPRITPTGATSSQRASNGAIYDLVGRYYTAGLRFRF